MTGFLTELDIRLLEDGRNAQLLAVLKYQDSLNRLWVVPDGFITDGASIPRALWSTVGSPFTGKYRRATVLHDFLYKTQPLPRLECDRLLLEAMMKDGTPKVEADAIYEGVRLGGWEAWYEDRIPHV